MVETKIRQIVEKIGGLHYEFNDWTRTNATIDYTSLPVCVNVLPVSGKLSNKNGNLRDYPNCLIAFMDKAELDFEGAENEITVNRMKGYAKRFIAEANRSGLFQPITADVPYSVVYDFLDANLTGIAIELQLKESVGDCLDNTLNP
ncbi:hypothetical protein M2132_000860 [Dysgonomonas sp. PH5-45]|uniref:hypothetical protein n=1 Tax=unclassified Dysgonomonas TaxID=2630389 RepID=UPI0024737B95|nr:MULTISPECIES: hypothetical protein [unclassified Dysgonomonas]MDH6354532.1 hypothetical protein [Dysgonomonas sp. PH5-45]MDH6387412.1 hypothetical protein [Dysgonomonas sp. PH5-37]